MKEYTPEEKGAMMQLQGLVGFSRYKDSLVGSPYSVRPDGTKVYDQLFSTQTHSVNLRTFDAMEKLGFIEIVKKDDKEVVSKIKVPKVVTEEPKETKTKKSTKKSTSKKLNTEKENIDNYKGDCI